MDKKQKIYFNYSIVVHKECKQYASLCPELDVASNGKSIEQACDNLKDAINCFIETYADLGELNKVLDEKGIVLNYAEQCPSVFLTEACISVPAAT